MCVYMNMVQQIYIYVYIFSIKGFYYVIKSNFNRERCKVIRKNIEKSEIFLYRKYKNNHLYMLYLYFVYRYKAKRFRYSCCRVWFFSSATLHTPFLTVACRSRIVGVVSCCNFTHRSNEHIRLIYTKYNSFVRKTERELSSKLGPGD